MAATMKGYDHNNLFAFVAAVIGRAEAQRLMEMYNVGTSKHWPGSTVLWQVDARCEVHGGKIMLFDRLNGHRVQEPFPHINWVHSALRIRDFKLRQCFFGEHLLPHIRDRPVAIVESEKTAIIATHYMPQYLWLASGGKQGCMKSEAISVLQGREVVLVPDFNATEDWRKKMDLFRELGVTVSLFEELERVATDEQRQRGLDIADFLTAEQTPEGIFEMMMQKNPILKQMVEDLQLTLVSVERIDSTNP